VGWRDSGMAGTTPRRRTRLIDTGDDAVKDVVDIINDLPARSSSRMDPKGGSRPPRPHQINAVVDAGEHVKVKAALNSLAS
jgi:hypothetical protein